tara:strand:+ start:1536 stop:1793 length:258 start_codon:yes stop_codon:yes gene_type:complete
MTDYKPLINENQVQFIGKTKKINILLVFIIIIFLIQVFSLVYMIILVRIANGINLFDINTTSTNEYIDKFKIIIDKICENYITCK